MNIFNKIQLKRPKSNHFDLSHDHKLSMNMGDLVPFMFEECLPGDKFTLSTDMLARMAPMVAPVMHQVNIYIHYFFVPNRILWEGWEDFITGNALIQAGVPQPQPTMPYATMSAVGIEPGSLNDYLGLPLEGDSSSEQFNILPHMAYYKIWYDWYRDQNLQLPGTRFEALPYYTQDTSERTELFQLRKRAWQHDYFTSALPFAQKGESVQIPYTSEDLTVKMDPLRGTTTGMNVVDQNGNALPAGYLNNTGGGLLQSFQDPPGSQNPAYIDPNEKMYIDSDDINLGGTINDLRTAYSLQRWLEKNARAGTRYVENILAHFGVHVGDARLQNAEYIGGAKQNMVISEVLQTSQAISGEGTDPTPQGTMAGHGVSAGSGKPSTYRCKEHGILMGIVSIVPKTGYMQGLPKVYSKFDRMDYYWQEFAHLGEQEIKRKEMFCDGNTVLNNETFGYIPRYSEYRYKPGRVSGDFRTSLDFWHLARKFSSHPILNESFIQCVPRNDIFAVTDESSNKIYAHIFNKIHARRLMPRFGNPGW